MSEEKKNEEVDVENTSTEKPEEKEGNTTETKKEEVVEPKETKQQEVVEPKETKQEEVVKPKEQVEPAQQPKVETPTPVANEPKKNPIWMTVLKVCGVVVLSAGCGFGGGYLAGQQSAEKAIDAAMEDMQSSFSFGGKGGMMNGGDSFGGGMFGNDTLPSQETTEGGAALGITVTTNDQNQLVVAAFATNSKAGDVLKVDDIIVKIDGEDASSYELVQAILAKHEAGDEVKVTVDRDGTEVTEKITLVEKETTTTQQNTLPSDGSAPSGLPSGDSSNQFVG